MGCDCGARCDCGASHIRITTGVINLVSRNDIQYNVQVTKQLLVVTVTITVIVIVIAYTTL